ncbi:MAG: hypothetical protein ACLPPF_08730, partial [Rhodomicrobium sp.]
SINSTYVDGSQTNIVGGAIQSTTSDGSATNIYGGFFQTTAANGNTVTISNTTGALSVAGGGLSVTGGAAIDGVTTFTNVTSANPNQGSTTINGAYASLSSPQGSITLDATTDPTVKVTNGTSTTTIHNGEVTTQGAGSGITVLNAAGTATQFTANDTGLISAEGNRIQDVATPILGTDAANKAYVDAGLKAVNQRVDQSNQGVAIAMSLQNPVLTGSDRFGVAVNFGDFAGNNAVGASAVGIIGQNMFGAGEKFGLTGGFGVSNNQAAGRVGMQVTW